MKDILIGYRLYSYAKAINVETAK